MSNDTMERGVTLNDEQELYVIQAGGGGFSCLGYDVCLDRIDRITTELAGRLSLPEDYIDGTVKVERGTLGAYDVYRALEAHLIKVCEEQDERAVYDLTPQLTGLEGRRVEVVDMHGEKRRFKVGRSTGAIPIHLELYNERSTGGMGAAREYKSVRVVR